MMNESLGKVGWAVGMALLIAGCAQVRSETRYAGVSIPSSLVDRAEKGAESVRSRAEACSILSKKLREADSLESLRFLRKGAELRDGDCCRQYLSFAEGPGVNLSQRLYARLFVEGLLEKGPIRTAAGADATPDLYYQLCWAWQCTEPRSPRKAQLALEAMIDLGLTPELARSEFLRQLIAESGAPAGRGRPRQEIGMGPVAGNPEERSGWLEMPPNAQYYAITPGGGGVGAWAVLDATAWGGGSEKLLLATGVLAFLVNDHGEPSFRGRFLWVRNCGTAPVYYSSTATGHANRELAPGAEELQPVDRHSLDENQSTTGFPLRVRFRPAR